MQDPHLLARRAAVATIFFAIAVCIIQIVATYTDALGLNIGIVPALIQMAITLGISYGIYRGGFGWAGLVTMLAALPILAAVGLVFLYSKEMVSAATAGLWIAYAIIGLSMTPLLAKATWKLWKASSNPKTA